MNDMDQYLLATQFEPLVQCLTPTNVGLGPIFGPSLGPKLYESPFRGSDNI